MNLPYFMNVLIGISSEQVYQVGSTPVEDLGLNWIVIQYDIQVNRMPQIQENITVKTFIREHNRLFTYREFEIYDEEGQLLVYVFAVFALIDENRKLSRIPQEITEGYGATESRRIRRMPKPKTPEDLEKANRRDSEVGYFDIDSNFHANNAQYFIWMLEALDDEFLATHDLTSGNVVFEKEVHIGETVSSFADVRVNEDETFTSRHEVRVGDVVKCVASFEWIENDHEYAVHEVTE
jgi:medium-chain acyl-[acyl-carrier-protein] hydrolase